MKAAVEIRALALAFPSIIRPNQWFRDNFPEVVAETEKHVMGKVWTAPEPASETVAFEMAMAPYLGDPFRGTDERRLLGPGETSVGLEARGAREALAAAGLGPDDVDLLISTSFLPDQVGVGNAAFVARELGLRCSAWNMETACSSSVVALQAASAMVAAGLHRRALVTVSCTYSRTCPDHDTLSWSIGDGAAAFVIEPAARDGLGLLGGATINTSETCGTIFYQLELDASRAPVIGMRTLPEAGRLLRATAEPYVRECCESAARQAGVSLADVDFFVVNTPLAWYVDFVSRALAIPRHKMIDAHRLYCNTGPVLMPGNLYHALAEHRIRPGDLVMLYSVGSVSTASAALFRWGDTHLGPPPAPPARTGLQAE